MVTDRASRELLEFPKTSANYLAIIRAIRGAAPGAPSRSLTRTQIQQRHATCWALTIKSRSSGTLNPSVCSQNSRHSGLT